MIKALAVENVVENKEAYLQHIRRQLQKAELPLVDEVLDDIWWSVLEVPGTRVSADTDPVSSGALSNGASPTAGYNRIPGEVVGPCRPVLLAVCMGNGFEKWLIKVLEHVARCQHEQIYLVTNQWGPTVWKKYERHFHNLPANVTIFLVVSGRLVVLSG